MNLLCVKIVQVAEQQPTWLAGCSHVSERAVRSERTARVLAHRLGRVETRSRFTSLLLSPRELVQLYIYAAAAASAHKGSRSLSFISNS